LYNKDPKLAALLTTPTLSEGDKSAIVAELQKAIGAAGSNETVKNFLSTLAENNRLSLLEGVCTKFGELISASRGEIEMTVTSAQVRHIPQPWLECIPHACPSRFSI
jgi:F-type H+-transporting ATPase subunit O